MAKLLKGAPVAAALTGELIPRAEALKRSGITPCLAILRVGERTDDLAYERGALKRCESVGIAVRRFVLPGTATQSCLMDTVEEISQDDSIHGCLLFRPLPKTLDEESACAALAPRKDADGITPASMAGIYSGFDIGYAPCTAQACMELLRYYGIEAAGKHAAVIGRSLVIGRPVAQLLMAADATVTVCHTKTRNLPELVREADLVVAATGRAEAIGPECFREGQVVLDVGINWSEARQKLVGDVDFESVEPLVAAISPVPNGVGSVTAAVLCKHVIESAERLR